MPWKVEEDKNGYIHVRSDKNGTFAEKEEAIAKAKEIAILNKTIMRSHTLAEGYETADFTSILLPGEWINKLESELKISKAEYMIAKNRMKDLKEGLKKAKVFKEKDKKLQLELQIKEQKITIQKKKMNLNENASRLKQAQRSNKNR